MKMLVRYGSPMALLITRVGMVIGATGEIGLTTSTLWRRLVVGWYCFGVMSWSSLGSSRFPSHVYHDVLEPRNVPLLLLDMQLQARSPTTNIIAQRCT